jgi:hypothetical protein
LSWTRTHETRFAVGWYWGRPFGRPSASDRVRVFQEFTTLDLMSRGRAEIVAGRGSFVESYPLFGLRLEDYGSLFAEKLELLLKIRQSTKVRWSGKRRAALTGQAIYARLARCRIRSPYGSVSAARPNLSFAQECSDFLSWLPSSAVSPDASGLL